MIQHFLRLATKLIIVLSSFHHTTAGISVWPQDNYKGHNALPPKLEQLLRIVTTPNSLFPVRIVAIEEQHAMDRHNLLGGQLALTLGPVAFGWHGIILCSRADY